MNQETSLTKIPQQPSPNTGLDDYETKPTVIQLIQTNHMNTYPNAVVGAFRDVAGGRNFVDERNKPRPITIIPLAGLKQRVLFPSQELGVSPLCRSLDGEFPVIGKLAENFGLVPQHTNCKTCPMNDWSEYNDRHSPRYQSVPPCRERPRLLFVDLEDEMPYIITFTSKSISPFRQLMQTIQRNITSDSNKNKRNPNYKPYNLYDYVVNMSSQASVNAKGKFHVVYFEAPERVAEPGKYYEFFDQYVVKPQSKFGHNFVPQDAGVEGKGNE
jgi:hypothetical protein